MNVNIEKCAAAYKNFFMPAGAEEREKGSVGKNIMSVNYEKSNDMDAGFFGYDKASNITGTDAETKSYLAEENKSIMDFLNEAVDTLKNLVTDEDYSAFSELGITADKEDMTTLVTVYERIQIQLAAYGEANATSLNISGDKIDKVIKSPALASNLKMAESIGDIDDNAKEYILKNDIEPTVKNIYMAVHAGDKTASNVKGTEISEEQWEQLLPQVEKFLEKNGIEADKKALDGAKWLMERDIPLTVDSLIKYTKLKEIEAGETRDTENIKQNMILSKVFGGAFENGYMTTGWISRETAKEAVDVIQQADEKAAYFIADKDLTFNVSNLKKYIDYAKENSDSKNTAQDYLADENEKVQYKENTKETDKKRNHLLNVLNQAKSVMTMAGVIIMEKLGINIEYDDIEDMVNEIKEEDKAYSEVFFKEPSYEKSASLINIMDIMEQLKGVPVAAVGAVTEKNEEFTVNNIYNEGVRLRQAYEKAGETYEAVGTQVRTDLGDNIKKAFNNVDTLIDEAGLTADDTYRRAVRVLGYNSMEINRDNIILMAEKTTEVDKVIKNITPKTAAYLIENNINPLDENIEELNDRLEQINSAIDADENEEYSKYLWKLEKTGAVTKEERQAFIELYRAIKTIEKADTRAVGAVVSEGVAFTLGNLLSAEKSRAKYGTTTDVNDNTGYYQGRLIKNKLSDLLEGIHGNKAAVSGEELLNEDIDTLWQTYASYEEQDRIRSLNNRYEAYRLNSLYGETVEYTEKMVYDLLDSGMNPNMENLLALSKLMKKNKDINSFFTDHVKAESQILDSFNTEEQVSDAYKDINNQASELLEKEMETETIETLKYKGIYNVTKFMSQAAGNKCYYIPMDMDGEPVMVKVKFSHSGSNENNIKITANDEVTGKVDANISVKEGKLKGYIVCSNKELEAAFSKGMDDWQQEIEERIGEKEEYTDRQLYDISKSFLKKLKDFGRLPINNVD